MWDESGRRYVDYVGAFGPLVLGHANRKVVEATTSALAAGGSFGVTVPAEVRLGELIRDRMPSMERIRFVNSGTEAAMSALRLARAATGRDLVIKFEGAYHGHSDSLLVNAGSGVAALAIPGTAGVSKDTAAHTLVATYNDLDSVAAQLQVHDGQVAAVIVEPVAANMGVVAPLPGFLEGLRILTRRAGALLIFDEVITGFRLGRGGAQELFGVRPDLTLLGKIIGGGLPVGAYGGRADLMDLVAPSGPVYQAGTLSGHPAVMAAGEATLLQLSDSVYRDLERTGSALESALAAKGVSVSRVGSLLTLFFREGPPRNFTEVGAADLQAFARFFERMLDAGILLPPSQFEAWFVSTTHDEEAVDATIAAVRATRALVS